MKVCLAGWLAGFEGEMNGWVGLVGDIPQFKMSGNKFLGAQHDERYGCEKATRWDDNLIQRQSELTPDG